MLNASERLNNLFKISSIEMPFQGKFFVKQI